MLVVLHCRDVGGMVGYSCSVEGNERRTEALGCMAGKMQGGLD